MTNTTKLYPMLKEVIKPIDISFSPFQPIEIAGRRGILKPEIKRAFVKNRLLIRPEIISGKLKTINITEEGKSEIEEWFILLEDDSQSGTFITRLLAGIDIDCMLSYQHYKDLGKFVVIKENTYQSAKGSGDYTNE